MPTILTSQLRDPFFCAKMLLAIGRWSPTFQPHFSAKPVHYTACGLDDVYLVNGFIREKIDGEDAITIEAMDGLWKAIGLALVTKRKALAPKEVRFLRSHMNLTQAELGAKLRVSDQSVARWEKGETSISGPADVLLRVFFFACERAQPEGTKILEHLVKMLEELSARDEPQCQLIKFRHKKKSGNRRRRGLTLCTRKL